MSEARRENEKEYAGVVVPPPLIFLLALALGYVFQRLWPLPAPPRWLAVWLGGGLIVVAVIVGLLALVEFWRAGTTIFPFRPTTTLITSGPFSWSRNPLYLSLSLGYLGAALALEWTWSIVLLIPALISLHYSAVVLEERYLERRFGDLYDAYRRRVRRWL